MACRVALKKTICALARMGTIAAIEYYAARLADARRRKRKGGPAAARLAWTSKLFDVRMPSAQRSERRQGGLRGYHTTSHVRRNGS